MTEQEWLECAEPQKLLDLLRGKASDRKLRLFAVACCRRIQHLLEDERSRHAVAVAERFADNCAGEDERHRAAADASRARSRDRNDDALAAAYYTVSLNSPANHPDAEWGVAIEVVGCVSGAITQRYSAEANVAERVYQSCLLRDIFGAIPFRHAPLDRAWLTPTVVSLATAIYDERDFDRLPILADALEDAGCSSQEFLGHCHGPGPHIRGCWVLDLVLARA
jgi:hypothetical protein